MGTLMYGLYASDILTINDTVFKDTLAVIGALSGFDSSQIASWTTVLKRVSRVHQYVLKAILLPPRVRGWRCLDTNTQNPENS